MALHCQDNTTLHRDTSTPYGVTATTSHRCAQDNKRQHRIVMLSHLAVVYCLTWCHLVQYDVCCVVGSGVVSSRGDTIPVHSMRWNDMADHGITHVISYVIIRTGTHVIAISSVVSHFLSQVGCGGGDIDRSCTHPHP